METLEEPLHVSSPLGTRVRIEKICQDCELEISGILLMVDLRVLDISDFDVILSMDWLTGLLVICSSLVAYTLSLYVYIHEAFIILSCYLNCSLT